MGLEISKDVGGTSLGGQSAADKAKVAAVLIYKGYLKGPYDPARDPNSTRLAEAIAKYQKDNNLLS
ncbi:MAG: hypothetical protein ACPGO3_15460 [Magnetospiraceae bacterium]